MTESYRTLIMLRIATVIALGFCVARYIPQYSTLIILASLTVSIIAYGASLIRLYWKPFAQSIAIWATVFSLAVILYQLQDNKLRSSQLMDIDGYHEIIAVSDSYSRQRKTTQLRARLLAVDSIVLQHDIYVQLSIRDSSVIHPRDTMIAGAYIRPNQPDSSVYSFDYPLYLMDHGIGYQGYVPKKPKILSKSVYLGFDILWFGWRSDAINFLKEHLSPRSFGLAASMVLGYRNELDRELSDQFADTGAIHILAVSGMHVGIVLFILMFFLKNLPIIKSWDYRFKDAVVTPILLLYVFLTGAAPSVVRATILFFFWRLAKWIERDGSSLNIWASAAVAMLLYNPKYLWDVGFQLSFTAVLSIIVFMPIIGKLWYSPYCPVRFIWNTIAMSIAAQILIFPLSLFYFHQFPILFPLSSVFAILMAFLIIPTGFALLLFRFQPLTEAFSWLLDWLTYILEQGILWMSSLPQTTIHSIWINHWELLFIYSFLFGLVFFVISQHKAFLFGSLTLLVVLLLLNTRAVYSSKTQMSIHTYDGQCINTDVFLGQMIYTDEGSNCRPRSRENYRMSKGANHIEDISSLCHHIR